ncbi:hypothetical protein ANME2D_01548 [Candidatus Methanoperedens nitroreducens]|uniref:Uncharacterized protein n=1 Tax=Candidatus Methanoperedens nitratireducens TaxID=1392998 RepID=A0A062V9W9_9EURY|nr:hypothetical protein [Candidatus Methanoperedens nitroreducens]KCZ72145.1 hypothetical protein ANME2D_01548 [Candidatus Methanoperedens nitroreducens]MDJ1421878.1 hypothetical protein [Candidatus Methanoperedens sp.]
MIFPAEYKRVGVTRTDPTGRIGCPIYFTTEYLIADLPYGYAIYRVKSEGEGLLKKLVSLELIAKGEQVKKFEEKLDSHDRTLLIESAIPLCKGSVNTVLFEGMDRHITFVYEPGLDEVMEIEIIDISPPEPPWLAFAIQRLIRSGILGELDIRFTTKLIDLRTFEGGKVVFPCHASELKGKYLDTDIDIEDNSELVGCDISKQIFELRFPSLSYRHINMCPIKAHLYTPTRPFITRCCQSKKSGMININGIDGAVVHWGASEYDIVDAIRMLVRVLRGNIENNNRASLR